VIPISQKHPASKTGVSSYLSTCNTENSITVTNKSSVCGSSDIGHPFPTKIFFKISSSLAGGRLVLQLGEDGK